MGNRFGNVGEVEDYQHVYVSIRRTGTSLRRRRLCSSASRMRRAQRQSSLVPSEGYRRGFTVVECGRLSGAIFAAARKAYRMCVEQA